MENQSFTQNPKFGFNTYNSNMNELPPMPNNNMPLAIVGTIMGLCSFCCIGLILGIISIVFSTQVKTKYNMGDYYGAVKASKNSKILAIIAIVLGVIGLAYSIIMLLMNGWDYYMSQYETYFN